MFRTLFETGILIEVFPQPRQPRPFPDAPENVESAFRDGEMNLADRRYRSAAGDFRTAIERTAKHLGPKDEVGRPISSGLTLYKRIEALAADNALPPAMIELMHEVRFLGNEIHEMEDPTQDDVEAGSTFIALLLTYLYELPARVAAAKARRDEGGADREAMGEAAHGSSPG